MKTTTKKVLSLVLSLLMVLSVLPIGAVTASADNEYFLMAYFTGNLQTEQQIRFAVSTDGVNFKPLNGGKAILQEKSTDTYSDNSYQNTDGVRDPYIFEGGDGYYYCIATDLDATAYGFWGNQSQMVLWRSADLINWSDAYYINVAQICNAKRGTSYNNSDFQRTWAPEVFYENGTYMVYFALAGGDYNATTMYYMTTDDLMDWTHYSAPQQLYNPGADSIDADIIKQNGVYYMFYKDETTGRNTVCLATATALTGPYSYVGQFATSSTTGAIEGCEVYTVGGNYYLVADRYGAAGNFAIYNMGSNLAAVAAKGSTISVTDGNPISTVNETTGFTNLTARHGAVMHISASQYADLCEEYGGVTSDDVMYNFTTAYSNTTTGWAYATYNDSSLHDIDIMFKENDSSAKIAHDSGFATLRNATFFVNDADVRAMLPDDVYTVSFDYSLESTTNLSAPIFALATGAGAPEVNTDYVMIFGNGDMYVRKSGESTDTYVATAALTLGVTYHYDIVSDGTNITFYRDGEVVGSIAATVDFPDSGTRYAAFGFTDGHSSAGYGYGTYSHIRFRDAAVSAATLKAEFDKNLIYTKAGGNDTVNDMPGALEVSNANNSNLVEPVIGHAASSYTLAGWVNPGDTVNYNVIMGLGDNRWTPAPYGRYFALTEDGQIRFNYCSGSNGGGDWSEHYIDIGNTFSLSPSTWSYLQVNIVPISDVQVKICVWVDGVQTYSNDISLTTKLSGADTPGDDYAYGMLGFMQLPTNVMFLGNMGTPGWFHTDNDTSYVKDVRFYAQALDPATLYCEAKDARDMAIARDYVEANYVDLNTTPTFTVRPYHVNDPVSDGVYSNIVYSPQNTTSWSGNGIGDTATSVGRIDFKVAMPMNSVAVYDGEHDVMFPIQLESKCNNTGNTSHIIHYARVDQSTCLELRQDWQGYSSAATDGNRWQYWAGKYVDATDDFAYLDSSSNESSDSQRDANSRFWWNILYYNGTGDTNNYYEVDRNISFYARTSYKTTSRQNKYGTFTSLTNNYVINYQPIYKILKGTTKIPNTAYTAYNYYNSVVKGNEWMYTDESLNQYFLAMYKVLTCDPNNYTYSANTEAAVISCANDIKAAKAEFDAINLVKKTFTVNFINDAGTTVDTRTITAGDALGTLPANTATAHVANTATHNVYSWDTTAQTVVRDNTDYNEVATAENCTFVDGTHVPSTPQADGYTDKVCSVCGYVDESQRVYDTIDWTDYNAAKAALEAKLADDLYSVDDLEDIDDLIANDTYYNYTPAQQANVRAYYANDVATAAAAISAAAAALTPVDYAQETADLADYVEQLAAYDRDMYSKTFTYTQTVNVNGTDYEGLIYGSDADLQAYIASVLGSVNTYDVYLNESVVMADVPYGTAVRINGDGTAETVNDITVTSEGDNYAWYYCYSAPSTNNARTASKYYATAPSYSFYVHGDTYVEAVSTTSTENSVPVTFIANINGAKFKTFAVAYADATTGEIADMPAIPNYAGYTYTGNYTVKAKTAGADFYEQGGVWYATGEVAVTYNYEVDSTHAADNSYEIVVWFLDGNELLPLNDYDTYEDVFGAPSSSLASKLKIDFNYNEKVYFIDSEFSDSVASLIGNDVYAYAMVDDLDAYADGEGYTLTPIAFGDSYAFYAYDNLNLVALTELDYEEEIATNQNIVLNARDGVAPVYNTQGGVEKFTLVASFAAKGGVTATEYGYLFTTNTSTTAADLTLDKVGKNGVARMKSTMLTCGNQFVVNVKNPSTSVSFRYVAYVTYTDQTGTHTIYSPVCSGDNNF